MAQTRKYINIDEFNEYKEESRKSRKDVHERINALEKSIPQAVHDGMEKYMSNGGGDIIKEKINEANKSQMETLGLDLSDINQVIEARKDSEFVRSLREKTLWYKDRVFLAVIGMGIFLFANGDKEVLGMIGKLLKALL